MVALDSYREATTAAGRNRQVVQSNSHRAVEQTPGSVIRQQMLGVVGSREKIRRTAEKSPAPTVTRQAAMGLVHRCSENTLVWRPQSVAPAWHPG
jgi:hypothetical protein